MVLGCNGSHFWGVRMGYHSLSIAARNTPLPPLAIGPLAHEATSLSPKLLICMHVPTFGKVKCRYCMAVA